MVQWCIRLTRLTLVCEVIRYRLVQVWQNLNKRLFGLAARKHLPLSLIFTLSFSSSSYFLSFSIQKRFKLISAIPLRFRSPVFQRMWLGTSSPFNYLCTTGWRPTAQSPPVGGLGNRVCVGEETRQNEAMSVREQLSHNTTNRWGLKKSKRCREKYWMWGWKGKIVSSWLERVSISLFSFRVNELSLSLVNAVLVAISMIYFIKYSLFLFCRFSFEHFTSWLSIFFSSFKPSLYIINLSAQ